MQLLMKDRIVRKPINELYIFEILFGLLGILYFISVPLFRVPDEREHFERAYEISQGYFVSDRESHGLGGRELPSNIDLGIDYKEANIVLTVQLLKEGEALATEKSFKLFANTSLYSPLTYFPQVVGIWIAHFFTSKVIYLIFSARLFNWLFAFGLISYAVYKTPICKKAFMMVCLFPMTMQEMVSCAPDGTGIAVVMALAAFVFYQIYVQTTTFSVVQKAEMVFLAIYISQYKIVYLPFCLLLFLIPYERFGSKKAYRIWAVSLGVLVVGLSLFWLRISSPYQHAFTTYAFETTGAEQISFVLSHPFRYIGIIVHTLRVQAKAYYDQAVGMSLGYYNVYPDPRPIYLWEWLFPVVAILELENESVKIRERLFLVIVSILVTILIFTGLYVQFNKPEAPEIIGVQGRYFLPLLPILFGAIKIRIPLKRFGKAGFYALFLVECALHAMVIRTAFMTFWGR